jgi:ADP-ribose pyrophosphatase
MQKLTTSGALERYFEVMREYPQLFEPTPERHGLSLVTDRETLVRTQKELRKKAEDDGTPVHYYTLGVLCEDEWYMVIRDLVKFRNGKEGPYIRFVCKKGALQGGHNVIVVPYADGKVLVTRQFRHERRGWVWETPRGFAEPGVDVFSNGRRELLEETGLTASKLHLIYHTHEVGASIMLAEVDGCPQAQNSDETESIAEARWLTLVELERWILDGIITDAALLAIFIYLQKITVL